MSEWICVKDGLPENQNTKKSRRRYMAYDPRYGGYVFRCWYSQGFGAVYPESMLGNVTHYRLAKRSEKDYQLSDEEFNSLFK